jgi:hypothetical protein
MNKYTDTERLDFLQSLLDKKEYTGKCKLRLSSTGRGFRLHETSQDGAENSVRVAIDNYINEHTYSVGNLTKLRRTD